MSVTLPKRRLDESRPVREPSVRERNLSQNARINTCFFTGLGLDSFIRKVIPSSRAGSHRVTRNKFNAVVHVTTQQDAVSTTPLCTKHARMNIYTRRGLWKPTTHVNQIRFGTKSKEGWGTSTLGTATAILVNKNALQARSQAQLLSFKAANSRGQFS